jgi:hypothetical protein
MSCRSHDRGPDYQLGIKKQESKNFFSDPDLAFCTVFPGEAPVRRDKIKRHPNV